MLSAIAHKILCYLFNHDRPHSVPKAEDIIESTHLSNEPWVRTLKEKGRLEKIDYMLSIDNIDDCLSEDEAQERKEEISEMHKIFGVA